MGKFKLKGFISNIEKETKRDDTFDFDTDHIVWERDAKRIWGKSLQDYVNQKLVTKEIGKDSKEKKYYFTNQGARLVKNALKKKFERKGINIDEFLDLRADALSPYEGVYGANKVKYAVWKNKIKKSTKLMKALHSKLDKNETEWY